ncbi:MAG TPA: SDR family NAD(P)-dependent oxidoreductase [Rhodopila sp.]|uniref:SDR family NAD(P)-dependent oxidoreductase n=1 Tax=Rhodopila sp. TaxID=2480087 RepID=UPI002C9A09E4|nr:SDR family NAD(P)-dependent oxidoreductase [Rhodopila sp.]HVY15198.1 SDR family NAD(P)-dependent oxidoreductase [Rhodopila sp.]
MSTHPALAANHVAVITGAAGGIGLAVAKRFAALGMRICLADLSQQALDKAAEEVAAQSSQGRQTVLTVPTDVSRIEDVTRLKDAAYQRFGQVDVLMNNAGTAPGGGPWENIDAWRRVLDVNLWGVINGVQVFTPHMLEQGTPAAIVNTGSKQGITCPPGDTAYNVSKAGVKVLTEALAHSLRNTDGSRITAHLLVPGSTFTGMTRRRHTEKPPGAWWPEQVADMLIEGMNGGDFYIICPDNEVTREIDNRRILWAAQDITENRPPLSRWHPDYSAAFERFLNAETADDPSSAPS